ncbi:LysR family transcriptional regulator [Legionella dresdenensis]|uniref:LysR family transcriptional regulator n=1 Tax=Legionella dresdenensis TaxID=450200 RepID=A0ABV8CH46_9GAMM
MSDLDRFEIFTYAAQTCSLSQAAKHLSLTKASISKQIKKLEADLGVDLFIRTNQRLHLTNQGEILLQQCLRLKKELEDTRAVCQDFHATPQGTLHVVALDYFAKKIIYPRLQDFMQKYPELDLIIDISERVPNFEQEQVDIAVGFSLIAPDNVIQGNLTTTRHVMCASPAYFKKHGKPNTLQDLRQHTYIGHYARHEICSTHLKRGHEIKIKPSLVLNHVTGMVECAKAGLGIVQLPFYILEESLISGDLVEVLSSYQAVNASVYYFYPKFRYTQPKVRCFIDFFLKK